MRYNSCVIIFIGIRIKELEAELAQLKNAKLIPVIPGKTRNITSNYCI